MDNLLCELEPELYRTYMQWYCRSNFVAEKGELGEGGEGEECISLNPAPTLSMIRHPFPPPPPSPPPPPLSNLHRDSKFYRFLPLFYKVLKFSSVKSFHCWFRSDSKEDIRSEKAVGFCRSNFGACYRPIATKPEVTSWWKPDSLQWNNPE